MGALVGARAGSRFSVKQIHESTWEPKASVKQMPNEMG